MMDEQDLSLRAFTTPPGGIMTQEVGAITGDVEVWLGGEHAQIRYRGADDTYTVRGTTGGMTIDQIVQLLSSDPGVDQYNNPKTTDLATAGK
jgi:hypothetical protein